MSDNGGVMFDEGQAPRKRVGSWRRWVNLWRLQRTTEDGVTIEYYVTRRGATVTRIIAIQP